MSKKTTKYILAVLVLVVIIVAAFLVYKSQNPPQPLNINYKIYQNLDGFYVEYPEWQESDFSNLEKIYPKNVVEGLKSNVIVMAADFGGAQLTISKKVYGSDATAESVVKNLIEDRQQLIPTFKILNKKINGNEIEIDGSFELSGFKMLSFSKGFLIRGLEESNAFYNIEISVIKDKLDDYQSVINHIFNSEKVKNIIVFTPGDNQMVKSPILVKGRARVFENTFTLRLKDSDGKVLFEDIAMAQAPDVGLMGDFQKQIPFVSNKNSGILEVFWRSPKDGAELDKVSISLKFSK